MNRKKSWFPSGGHFLSNLMVVLIGITFYLALSNLRAVRIWAGSILDVVSPFLAGIAIAYLLNAPTALFERTLFKKSEHRRGLSILCAYLMAFAVVVVLLTLVLPQVVASIMSFASNLNIYLSNFSALIQALMLRYQIEGDLLQMLVETLGSYQGIMNKAVNFLTDRLPQLLNYGVAIGSGVIAGVTALISSMYMLAGKERLLAQLRKLLYAIFPRERTNWFLSVCAQANATFSGFIIGKLLDSLIIGILCFVACVALRIPMPVLFGVVIGFTNIIPFFGPIIGAVPCIMVLLIMEPFSALKFLILIIILQQFDGNILGPRILGNSTGLGAIWVLIAIVVGGGLFGFTGMILGVPTFAVIYALTREWVNHRLAEKGIEVTSPSQPPHSSDTPPDN